MRYRQISIYMSKDSVCELNLQFATRSAKESGNDIHHNSLMT